MRIFTIIIPLFLVVWTQAISASSVIMGKPAPFSIASISPLMLSGRWWTCNAVGGWYRPQSYNGYGPDRISARNNAMAACVNQHFRDCHIQDCHPGI